MRTQRRAQAPARARDLQDSAPVSRRRLLQLLPVLLLALAGLAGAHLLWARRFVLDADLGAREETLGLALVALLGAGSVLQPLLLRLLPAPWFRLASWPFLVWMGVFWIGLQLVWATDGLWLLVSALGGSEAFPAAKERAAILTLLLLALVSVALLEGLRPPRLRPVVHRLARWPEGLSGFRIVQISDLHFGPILGRGFARALTRRVNALAPDLIVITGDLVDGPLHRLRDDVEPLCELRARYGVYFVTGNHDAYSGDEAWVARVAELGIRPLRNARVRIESAGTGFWLAGVDDHRGDWARGSSEDLPAALAGWDRHEPVVLLAHDPATFREASLEGVDLQLSGHTHGGQIWPFRWLVRLTVPWVEGLHTRRGSSLYVSRGTGFWGPPMRLLAPSEITVHELQPGAAGPLLGVSEPGVHRGVGEPGRQVVGDGGDAAIQHPAGTGSRDGGALRAEGADHPPSLLERAVQPHPLGAREHARGRRMDVADLQLEDPSAA